MPLHSYKIGDLARDTGTKPVTIRYYEKIGLLASPARTDANYRAYDRAALARLRFIRRCRALGFSLDQVRDLLSLSTDTRRSCEDVDQMTLAHLNEVERKIHDLKALADELRRLSTVCEGGVIGDCRIIEAISPQ